jgi:hypothetical protein
MRSHSIRVLNPDDGVLWDGRCDRLPIRVLPIGDGILGDGRCDRKSALG